MQRSRPRKRRRRWGIWLRMVPRHGPMVVRRPSVRAANCRIVVLRTVTRMGYAIVSLLLLPLVAALAVPLLAPRSWIAELVVSLRVTEVAYTVVLLPVALLTAFWLTPLVLVLLTLVGIPVVALWRPSFLADLDPDLSVVSFNVFGSSNSDWPKTLQVIRSCAADVVVLLESTDMLAETLRMEGWPYTVVFHDGEDPNQVTVLAKAGVQVTDVSSGKLEEFGACPVAAVEVTCAAGTVTVVGAHTKAPSTAAGMRLRDAQLRALATWVSNVHGNLVVVGDLNVTPFSPSFRLLTSQALAPAFRGSGVLWTWAGSKPGLVALIDHAFLSPGLLATSFRRLQRAGSDHHPIEVKFAFRL